jgi:hypothetical protein
VLIKFIDLYKKYLPRQAVLYHALLRKAVKLRYFIRTTAKDVFFKWTSHDHQRLRRVMLTLLLTFERELAAEKELPPPSLTAYPESIE